jgi:hypothetical protein
LPNAPVTLAGVAPPASRLFFFLLAACGECDEELTLTLHTDSYGGDTTWALVEDDLAAGCASASARGGPFGTVTGGELFAGLVVSGAVCAGQAYTLTLFDSFGDGTRDGAEGCFELWLGDVLVGGGGGNFTSQLGPLAFVVPAAPSGLPTQGPSAPPSVRPSEPPPTTPRPTPPPPRRPSPRPAPRPTPAPTLHPTPPPSARPSVDAVACGPCDQTLELRLRTDSYGPEVTWRVASGDRAAGCSHTLNTTGGPFEQIDGGKAYAEALTVNACTGQAYTFTAFDSFGDGMALGAEGYFELWLGGRLFARVDGVLQRVVRRHLFRRRRAHAAAVAARPSAQPTPETVRAL